MSAPVRRSTEALSREDLPPPRQLRVLFASWRDLAHPNAGGSEVVVHNLIERLNARGHRAALVCGGPPGRHQYPALTSGGTYGQYARAPFVARRFRHWDLLVDVANGIPYFSPIWWRGPRLCFVHHVHDEQWNRYYPRPIAAAGRFVECSVVPRLYLTTPFVAVSPSTKRSLERVGVAPDRITLVHNGVDDELLHLTGKESAEPLFVALGRLAPNKGVDRILDAWEQVRPVVGGRLVVVGDGPERDALTARRVDGVEFRGKVSHEEKLVLLGSAWLLVHAAHHEGWGLAIMEAAAAATPSLAYRADGVCDSIIDGVTGHLADDHDSYVAEWCALAANPDLRATLGQAARRRAASYTWDRTADEFLVAAYKSIAARR